MRGYNKAMSNDKRDSIYRALHTGQMSRQEAGNHQSALKILGMLREYVTVGSLLDVGCGLGTWLKAAWEIGIHEVMGVEGPWLEAAKLVVDPKMVKKIDLERRFAMGRRYDLAVCLEVAEHLNASAADGLVHSLVDAADHVLFSAAIPYQGGEHHVNEQYLPYWMERFSRHDYVMVDLFRGRLWEDGTILWWLRQNMVLFIRREMLEKNEKLRGFRPDPVPIRMVHPELFENLMKQANRILESHKQILAVLNKGGRFEVTAHPDSRLDIRRLGP